MINTSLSTGLFPDVLKIAKEVIIFKSNDKTNKSTSAFLEAESVHEMERKVTADLVKMHSWLCSNKLSLNALKSSCMIFTDKIIPNDIIIKIDNAALNSCSSLKFLRIYIFTSD